MGQCLSGATSEALLSPIEQTQHNTLNSDIGVDDASESASTARFDAKTSSEAGVRVQVDACAGTSAEATPSHHSDIPDNPVTPEPSSEALKTEEVADAAEIVSDVTDVTALVVIRSAADDRDYTVRVDPDAPLDDCRAALDAAGLPASRRLFLLGKPLRWAQSLSSQGWKDPLVLQAF